MKQIPAQFQQFSLEQVEAAMRAMNQQMRETDDKYHKAQAPSNHYLSVQKSNLEPVKPSFHDQQLPMNTQDHYSRPFPYQSMQPQNYNSIQMQMQEQQMKIMQEQHQLRLMQEQQFKAMHDQQFRAIQEQQSKSMQQQQIQYMSMMQEQQLRAMQEQQSKSMQEQQFNYMNMMQEKHFRDAQEQSFKIMQENQLKTANLVNISAQDTEAIQNPLVFENHAPPTRDHVDSSSITEEQRKRQAGIEKKKLRDSQERQAGHSDMKTSQKQASQESVKTPQRKSKKANDKKSINEQPTYQILKRPVPDEEKAQIRVNDKTIENVKKNSDNDGAVQKEIEIDFEDLQKGVSLDSENFPELGRAQNLERKTKVDRPKTGGGDRPRRGSRMETNFFFSDTANRVADEDPDAHLPSEVRNKGLMRKFEQEFIAKIQISNLVSDDPYADDYYYQIYSLLKKNPDEDPISLSAAGLTWQQSLLTNQLVTGKGNSVTVSNQMEKQMKRLIEGRKQKAPREGTLSLEGALGKISSTTVRNPKKAIQIEPTSSKAADFSKKLSKITVLQSIENVYSVVLALEQMKRIIPDDPKELDEWF